MCSKYCYYSKDLVQNYNISQVSKNIRGRLFICVPKQPFEPKNSAGNFGLVFCAKIS